MLRAITFDFWDTLAKDDSDEPKRAARGLAPKPEARRALFVAEVLAHHPELGAARAAEAWAGALARFNHHWHAEHRTPSVAARVADALHSLGLAPTPGFDALVRALEGMEVALPPDPAPAALETLPLLAERFQLGIISDTIVTPGRGLQEILAAWGVLQHFSVFVFSDEVGAAKPSAEVFRRACEGFGVAPEEAAHVGDREINDVLGPQRFGMKGFLYTGVKDRRDGPSAADLVYDDHAALLGLLDGLR